TPARGARAALLPGPLGRADRQRSGLQHRNRQEPDPPRPDQAARDARRPRRPEGGTIMSTDDDLTTLLRRGFTQATADLDPEPDLACAVRRRYVSARRRRLAIAVAVPAAALAAGSGLALAGQDIPNHTGVAVAPAASAPAHRTAPVTTAPVKPASYQVVAL